MTARTISSRVQGFTESVIREMTRVNAEHGGVNLAQGFPNFAPPKELVDDAGHLTDDRLGEPLDAPGDLQLVS